MRYLITLSFLGLSPVAAAQGSLVIPSGQFLILNTDQNPTLILDELIVEEGAFLRITGRQPLIVLAGQRIVLDGEINASGLDGPDATTPLPFYSASPTAPGIGTAAGGSGGQGSPKDFGQSEMGAPGLGIFDIAVPWGGRGGESGYLPSNNSLDRQGAGGGGGRLAPDEAIAGSIEDPENRGLVAAAGAPGSLSAFSAVTDTLTPAGGAPGDPVFVDGDPANDFFGFEFGPSGLIAGELQFPLAGSGGGGGGDSLRSDTFPLQQLSPISPELAGGGGGAGGGLVLMATLSFEVGPKGRLVADGGRGGRGESSNFLNGIGGAGGGGSGGMILVQAATLDLSDATSECFSARGGYGGPGMDLEFFLSNHGGMGGPGLVQLHAPDPALVQLPQGTTLEELSAPDAKILQPLPVVLP